MLGTMELGAIAMIDALGWKGIWRHAKGDQAVAALRQIESVAQLTANAANELHAKHLGDVEDPPSNLFHTKITTLFLSDTIVIAVGAPQARAKQSEAFFRHGSVQQAGYVVGRAIAAAALVDPPICYRGAITSGEYYIDGNFLVGPAIDRAAELMDAADAGVVRIDPKDDFLRYTKPLAMPGFVPAAVPLKDGRSIQTTFIDPMWWYREHAKRIREGITRSFDRAGSSPSIHCRSNYRIRCAFSTRQSATLSHGKRRACPMRQTSADRGDQRPTPSELANVFASPLVERRRPPLQHKPCGPPTAWLARNRASASGEPTAPALQNRAVLHTRAFRMCHRGSAARLCTGSGRKTHCTKPAASSHSPPGSLRGPGC